MESEKSEQRKVGRITMVDPAREYGFIYSDSTEYFFHSTVIDPELEWLKDIKPGLLVEFSVMQTLKGLRAVDVKRKA